MTEKDSPISCVPIRKALITVFDKTGLEPLIEALKARRVQLFSTGGTAKYLKEKLGVTVIAVESITQFPELMEGRVKTLHPKVFGGILARREEEKDIKEAESNQIPLFDLVVVNLYPFSSHLNEDTTTQSSFVDIGGPALIRSAAKNHRSVTVLSDPSDYSAFLTEYESNNGGTSISYRKKSAVRAFERTSKYDSLIAKEWGEPSIFPNELKLQPLITLRYGENPHQQAGWVGLPEWKTLQGKELSYNNLLDADAASSIIRELKTPAAAIVKHNNPCGVANINLSAKEVFTKAFHADSRSAFGGIVALNVEVDGEAATMMSQIFLEVIMAPSFSKEAIEIFARKTNLRLIEWKSLSSLKTQKFEVRRAMDGWLVQTTDCMGTPNNVTYPTVNKIQHAQWPDLNLAWLVAKYVRSNAIVIAKDGVTLGIGAGQMSRVDAVNIALQKASEKALTGAVLASDAFFPFRDNIDLLKGTGITAIIQPGGSQRDSEVIEACNEIGIAMVFTGCRHFRH